MACGSVVDQRIKGTPGITGLSCPRVHIDGKVWHLDVGSSHPGAAAAITPTISIGAGTPTTYPVGTAANTGSTTLVATGAVTVPINATTAAAMGNLAAAAYPAGVLGDVIKFEARFAKER